MRGRILLMVLGVVILGAVATSACSKRDSLFIEPGKADAKPAKHKAPAKP
jgi:hypothetical protein